MTKGRKKFIKSFLRLSTLCLSQLILCRQLTLSGLEAYAACPFICFHLSGMMGNTVPHCGYFIIELVTFRLRHSGAQSPFPR